VAANLEVAGLASPGWGIPAPETLAGPTLEAVDWACPDQPEELYLIPEPVRHHCYDIAEIITIRGVLSGGEHGEALYPGDPGHLTDLPNASFVHRDMESGYRSFPLHIPAADPLLLAWLNDERVKQGEEVEIIGLFGPGAVVCTKAPRLEGFPPMSPDEQQLWCEQQFSVAEIHGEGPDPIVEAPIADALWTPPPGVQAASGDGWRLLASSTRNQLAVTVASETVDVALDAEEYLRLWLSQASGEPPAVDFSTEFVVQFVPPVSGTCPWIAFTGIGTNAEEELIYGEFEQLSAELFLDDVPDNFACTTDATPDAFLVAVDRSLAPASEFRLRLQQERLCEECGITWDETVVHLDAIRVPIETLPDAPCSGVDAGECAYGCRQGPSCLRRAMAMPSTSSGQRVSRLSNGMTARSSLRPTDRLSPARVRSFASVVVRTSLARSPCARSTASSIHRAAGRFWAPPHRDRPGQSPPERVMDDPSCASDPASFRKCSPSWSTLSQAPLRCWALCPTRRGMRPDGRRSRAAHDHRLGLTPLWL